MNRIISFALMSMLFACSGAGATIDPSDVADQRPGLVEASTEDRRPTELEKDAGNEVSTDADSSACTPPGSVSYAPGTTCAPEVPKTLCGVSGFVYLCQGTDLTSPPNQPEGLECYGVSQSADKVTGLPVTRTLCKTSAWIPFVTGKCFDHPGYPRALAGPITDSIPAPQGCSVISHWNIDGLTGPLACCPAS